MDTRPLPVAAHVQCFIKKNYLLFSHDGELPIIPKITLA